MKIAIVGSSNSMLKDGWVKYYCRLVKNAQIDNYSIGGNSLLYAHLIIKKKRILEEYDYCIVDFAVNDQAFLDRGLISEELLMAAYLDLINKFKNSSCVPLFLILPVVPHWYNPEIISIRKHIVCLCQDFGVMYVDVYDFLYGLKNEFPEECLLRDFGHITSFTASILANQLSNSLQMAEIIFNNQPNCDIPSFNFRLPKMEQLEFINCEELNRSTSIAQFAVIKATKELRSQIIIYGQDLLCGIFFYDTSRTNFVYFHTDKGVIRKNLTTLYNGFFLRTFITPVGPDSKKILVSLFENGDFIHEKTNQYEPQPNVLPELELVDFLICDKTYREKIGVIRDFIINNRNRKIEHTEYQKEMEIQFRINFKQLEPGVVDDIVRYKIESNATQIFANDRFLFISSLHKIFRLLMNEKPKQFVVFGAGGLGKVLLESHLFKGLVKLVVDNDPIKWGKVLCGLTILKPNELLYINEKIILVATIYYEEVRDQLNKMGFIENDDFIDARPLYKFM